MRDVRIKILRPCDGRRGVRMQAGTIWTMRRPAAEAMVRRGVAMILNTPVIPETKTIRAPEPIPAVVVDDTDVWECRRCGKQYKTERGLDGHIEREHLGDE